ncbi:MAG: dihydropteroate synthase [Promethearchaeota archaeon]|nr:MAG: dihydropteroate synthase [Candidatus Lokiarchaeota archaeon]
MEFDTIYSKFFDFLEIGDNHPTIIMGVLNLSPESFYKGSFYEDISTLEHAALEMIKNGAKMLDLGARSTAPWSEKISIEEEVKRIVPAMKNLCKKIPENIIISVDTQYREVAKSTFDIASDFNKKIIINDVSCLKTDPSLENFVIEEEIPIILMASKQVPGDLLHIKDIINEFQKTITRLESKGFNVNNIILDPGIGHWVEQKTYTYDLKIISNLNQLRNLNRPILVALSRKSFIGSILNIPEPEHRYYGTLSATAIAVYNGAHLVRTHDVNKELIEIIKMAETLRENK